MVFALNLSSQTVSLALMSDGVALVEFPHLAPMQSERMTALAPVDGVVLVQGLTGQTATTEWTDPSGTPYSLRFQTGYSYAVIVDPKGQAALYSLPETYSSDPKLCIVNTTNRTLSQVQAAPDWAKNVKVYAQDMVPVVPSELFSFPPKLLGLYWQTLEQASTGTYTKALGFDGKPLRQNFESDHIYLFLAGESALRDLTPALD